MCVLMPDGVFEGRNSVLFVCGFSLWGKIDLIGFDGAMFAF